MIRSLCRNLGTKLRDITGLSGRQRPRLSPTLESVLRMGLIFAGLSEQVPGFGHSLAGGMGRPFMGDTLSGPGCESWAGPPGCFG
jgi:hypothetical protein